MSRGSDVAAGFARRFAGLERAHGHYTPARPGPDGTKVDGRAVTERSPATLSLWEAHLKGAYGVGIVPIRDDATCVWGAIDVDVYPLDLAQLEKDVDRLDLPLVVCRTKSGGAHLFVFLTDPAPAALVRGKLMEFAVALGYPGVEVFPKQTRLASENDFGNWLNMPYYGGAQTTRHAISGGRAISDPETFLTLADRRAVSPEALAAVKPPVASAVDEALEDGPPCLQVLASRGFPAGSRNNGLFGLAVYLRKRYGDDDWAERLDALNEAFMSPPLGHKEVTTVAKSAKKKTYNYKCNDAPLAAACNRQICLTRKFGVGGADDDPGVTFGELTQIKTEPPTWLWDVNGARLELTTAALMDQGRFHARCVEVIRVWPRGVKPGTWMGIVTERLNKATIIEVPVDATASGQLWEHFVDFVTGRARGKSQDELLLGKPWTDQETKRTHFRASDFLDFLGARRVKATESQVYRWLRERKLEHHAGKIKGRWLNWWSVLDVEAQTEPHAVATKTRDDEEL